jgi:hypothetical protein
MVKCPICGSEIEIAEVIDYDEMEEKSFDVAMYLSEYPQLRHCVRITTRCCTCHKGYWLTFHKPSFPDMETMRELAKELFAEKMKESEEDT